MFDFPPPSWQDLNEIQQQPLTSAFQLHWSPPTVTSLLLLVWLMLPVCVADLAVAVGWCFGGVIDRGVYVCSLINVTDLRGWFGPSYRHLPHAGASALPLLLWPPAGASALALLSSSGPLQRASIPPSLGEEGSWNSNIPPTACNSLHPWIQLWAAFAAERKLAVDLRQRGVLMLLLGLKVFFYFIGQSSFFKSQKRNYPAKCC